MLVQFDSERSFLSSNSRRNQWAKFLRQDIGLDSIFTLAGTSQPLITDISSLPTTESNTALILKPDGAGGTTWGSLPPSSSFKIEDTLTTSFAKFGSSGANEYLTVKGSDASLIAEFLDGSDVQKISISNTGKLVLDIDQTFGTTTGIWFGDGDCGIYEQSDDTLIINRAGAEHTKFDADGLWVGSSNSTPRIRNSAPSAVTPNILPQSLDFDTGIGRAGTDQLSLIAGATEGIRVEATKSTFSGDIELPSGSAYKINGVDILTTIPVPVGTGGQYTSIEAAITAGERKLVLVSDVTLSGDTDIITDVCEITALKETYNISTGSFRFRNSGVESGYIFKGLSITTSTTSPFLSSTKATIDSCYILSNAPAYWSGNAILKNCYIQVSSSLFSSGFDTCINCTFNINQNTYFSGSYRDCYFSGAFNILGGSHYNSHYENTGTIYQPKYIEHCNIVTGHVYLSVRNSKVVHSEFNNLTVSSQLNIADGNEIKGSILIGSAVEDLKLVNNTVTGATTINAGANNNIIENNTLTGGLTDNSGETSNIIVNNYNIENTFTESINVPETKRYEIGDNTVTLSRDIYDNLTFEDPNAGIITLSEIVDTTLDFFDATVGVGGTYATLKDAIDAGKYTLKLVGNTTESVNLNFPTGKIVIYGTEGNTITLPAATHSAQILLIQCDISVTGGVDANFTFLKCNVSFDDGYFGVRVSIRNSVVIHNSGLGIYSGSADNCDIILNTSIYAGSLINCRIVGNYSILNAYMVNCTSTSTLTLVQTTIVNCQLLNSTVTYNIDNLKLSNSNVNNVNLNSTNSIITGNKINGSLAINGDDCKISNNIIAGATTLGIGATGNLISNNTLTGGLTDNSGETTNNIIGNHDIENTFTESVNLPSGKSYKINGTDILTGIEYILQVALSDLDTDIEATTGVSKFPIPEDMIIQEAFISVTTAPTGSTAIWDININGSTILSTKISIDATELTSLDAAAQPVLSSDTFSKDDACVVDCDQIGATVAGQNPVLVIKYKKN